MAVWCSGIAADRGHGTGDWNVDLLIQEIDQKSRITRKILSVFLNSRASDAVRAQNSFLAQLPLVLEEPREDGATGWCENASFHLTLMVEPPVTE